MVSVILRVSSLRNVSCHASLTIMSFQPCIYVFNESETHSVKVDGNFYNQNCPSAVIFFVLLLLLKTKATKIVFVN